MSTSSLRESLLSPPTIAPYTSPVPPLNAARPNGAWRQSAPCRLPPYTIAPQARVAALHALEPIHPAHRPRVVPILGTLPDNWQIAIAIGIGIGLIFQLVQTGVNSSVKAGQADILAKLATM